MKPAARAFLLASVAFVALLIGIHELQQTWIVAVAAASAALALGLALPRKQARWLLIGNLLACAALTLSLEERVAVSFSAQGDRLQARAGGDLVQARDARYPEGGVSVWLAGADQGRPSRAAPERLATVPWLETLLAPAYDGYRSAVTGLSIETDGLGRSESGPLWQTESARLESIVDGAHRSTSVQLDALRPLTPFAILTRVHDGEAYQALALPESRDLSVARVRDGRVVQELENRGSPFRKDWIAALQSVLRELGRTWLFALLLLAVGIGIAQTGPLFPWERVWVWARGNPQSRDPHANPLPGEEGASKRAGRIPAANGLVVFSVLSLVAVAATAWIAINVFEGVPHDRDSVAYLFQGRVFASGAVTAPVPEQPEFFKEDFIVQHQGRWFGKYPPGHPLVLAIGVLAGAPWAVGPLLAGVAVALLGALGARLYGRGVGMLAAVLLLTSPFFLFMSGSFLAHPTSLVLTLAALLVASTIMWRQSASPHPSPLPGGELTGVGEPSGLGAAGGGTPPRPSPMRRGGSWSKRTLAGFASLSRLLSLGSPAPSLPQRGGPEWGTPRTPRSVGGIPAPVNPGGEGAGGRRGFCRPLSPWERAGVRIPLAALLLGSLLGALICTRQLTGAALGACLGAWLLLASPPPWSARLKLCALVALGSVPLIVLLLGFQQATTGSPFVSPQSLWWSFDTIGFGPGVGADGWHDPSMGLHDTWDRLTELQRHLFGWPFYLTLAPAMLPFIAGRARRADYWMLSVAAVLVAAYVLYWNRGMAYGPRYYYEALGPLCLLSARGFQVLADGPATGRSPLHAAGLAFSGALMAALVAFNGTMYLPQQARAFRGYLGVDGRRAAIVRESGVERGLVFVRDEPRGSWQPYASVFWLNSPRLDGPILFARDRGADENARLAEAMADRAPLLLTQSGLTPLPGRP